MQIRLETMMTLGVAGIGVLMLGVLGLFVYTSATTTPIHPAAEAVPTASGPAVPAPAAGAVDRARELMRAGVSEQNLPGASIAVGVDGTLVWAEGFGWSNLDARQPVTPRTPFRIGTASKLFTSAATGLLIESGALKLDDRIQVHVPQYPDKQWPVTLRALMAHTAGVPRDAGDEENLAERCEATTGGLRRFADRPLRFEPGTEYRDSNYGWILVSAAIEDAAGELFPSFVRKRIFEPLGLRDTFIDAADEPMRDHATFYFPRFAADPRYGPQPPREPDYSCFSGASAFLSTPSDLVRFVIAMTSGALLKPETVALLQASQRVSSGQATGYGLGWDLETLTLNGEAVPAIGYDGTMMDGMVATVMFLPTRNLVVAITANTAFADTASLAARVAAAFSPGGAETKQNGSAY